MEMTMDDRWPSMPPAVKWFFVAWLATIGLFIGCQSC